MGAMPSFPPDLSSTKTRILVIMVNTCSLLALAGKCFLAGLLNLISELTEEKCNVTLLFALARDQSCDIAAAMASERSSVTSIVRNESPLAYHFRCAMHCLNLSASAAVKNLTKQNAENVARKVVKMFKTNAKKTALLNSCIKADVSGQGETPNVILSAYVKPDL